jgi:phosphatidylethanolamine N-methyltransferase
MRKLYGDSLRKDAGFVKVMKSVASKNAKILESRAERHAPELKRVAREVIGTFDKVYEEAADAVEDFLARCRCSLFIPGFRTMINPLSSLAAPRISEVVEDTKILLRQSREKLVISYVGSTPTVTVFAHYLLTSRVANDLSSYDTSKYRVSIIPSANTGKLAFHLGEHIKIKWQAPHKHSRKNWIGLYRVAWPFFSHEGQFIYFIHQVGANKSRQVTQTSSMGMWLPVHDEEWDGDVPLGHERAPSPIATLRKVP